MFPIVQIFMMCLNVHISADCTLDGSRRISCVSIIKQNRLSTGMLHHRVFFINSMSEKATKLQSSPRTFFATHSDYIHDDR